MNRKEFFKICGGSAIASMFLRFCKKGHTELKKDVKIEDYATNLSEKIGCCDGSISPLPPISSRVFCFAPRGRDGAICPTGSLLYGTLSGHDTSPVENLLRFRTETPAIQVGTIATRRANVPIYAGPIRTSLSCSENP